MIHRRVTANEVVAANLYLLGGVSQVPPAKAGIELLLLEASERGTRKYPREVLERKMARLGSAIVASPSIDWTMVGVRSTVTAFDSTFAIFADRIMQPRLDSGEVETVRTTILSGVRQRGDDPEALLELVLGQRCVCRTSIWHVAGRERGDTARADAGRPARVAEDGRSSRRGCCWSW